MKHRLMGIPAAAVLAAGMLLAQTTPAPAPNPGQGRQQGKAARAGQHAGHLDRMARHLNLTQAQRDQAKAIFDQAKTSADPIRQQLQQSRQNLFSAAKTGNDAAVDSAAATQGQLMGQLMAIHAKAMGKVYRDVLTAEQKQQADQMQQRFEQGGMGMGPGMMGPHHGGPKGGKR